jgi:hypothetical protein
MMKNEFSETISLDGAWDFSLGEDAIWSPIQVPGCWEAQGFPKLVEGPAFYRKLIAFPSH